MGEDTVFLIRGMSAERTLTEISFTIIRGEILGVVGPHAAGKTLLMRILVGLSAPTKGDILFHAYTPKGVIECDVQRHQDLVTRSYGWVGPVPSFYDRLTVRENLEYFGALYELTDATIAKNAELLLRLFELHPYSHLLAGRLPMHRRQALDMACALIHNPPVLILDGVEFQDVKLRRTAHEVLRRINARGTTIIITSQHYDELAPLCSRIGRLEQGKLTSLEPPRHHEKASDIVIQSFPGDFTETLKRLHAEGIQAEREGTCLTVTTERIDHTLPRVLALLRKRGEHVVDVRIVRHTAPLPPIGKGHSLVVRTRTALATRGDA